MAIFLLSIFTLGVTVIGGLYVKRILETEYYTSLPSSLKNEFGDINVAFQLSRKIERDYKDLLESADTKFTIERGPHRLLQDATVRKNVEKYTKENLEDFAEDIANGRLDLTSKSTAALFDQLSSKHNISHRALLKTLLYMKHEIEYFTYRDSVAKSKPSSLNAVIKKSLEYFDNKPENLKMDFVKRLLFEQNIPQPLFFQIKKVAAQK